MRIKINKTKNYEQLYIIKDVMCDGKRKTVIEEKLGRISDLIEQKQMTRDEVLAWAKNRANRRTKEAEQNQVAIHMTLDENELISSDHKIVNCGYLFLQSMYHDLKLDCVMEELSKKAGVNYLNEVFMSLVFHQLENGQNQLLEDFKVDKNEEILGRMIFEKESYYLQQEIKQHIKSSRAHKISLPEYDSNNSLQGLLEVTNLILLSAIKEKLNHHYSIGQLFNTIQNMNLLKVQDQGYMPIYQRTQMTDDLHDAFGYRTDYQFMTTEMIFDLLMKSKNR